MPISLETPMSFKVFPAISLVAILASGIPVALDTKGTVLDALGFASIIKTLSHPNLSL